MVRLAAVEHLGRPTGERHQNHLFVQFAPREPPQIPFD
jgi:hypothetical protein